MRTGPCLSATQQRLRPRAESFRATQAQRAGTARNALELARGGAFAMRAAAAYAVADNAPLAESLSATSGGGGSLGAAVSAGHDSDAAMADADADVAPAGGDFASPTPAAELAEVQQLWLLLGQQVDLLTTNPVMEELEDGTVQVKKDKNGKEMRDNRLNSRHFNTVIRNLGEVEENPMEHRAIAQLLKAALSCPCPKTSNPDEICDALPCTEHTWWTRERKGFAQWRSAKYRLAAALPVSENGRATKLKVPVHTSMGGWCTNLIVANVERLGSMLPFVRSLGAAALAAYGPAAFPCGMLSLWDPCVAFISKLCDEENDSPLLAELALMAARFVESEAQEGKRPPSHAVAREVLALHLLQLLRPRLEACSINSIRLDPAQKGMAIANIRQCCFGNAGPGAGKTGTLVARLAYLYLHGANGQGSTPDRIVLVTFTRKAVDELRKRVLKARLPVPSRIVTIDSFVPTFLSSVCRQAKMPLVVLLSKDESEAAALGEQSADDKAPTLRDFVTMALARRGRDAGSDDTKQLAGALTTEVQKAMQHAGAYWSTADEAMMKTVARAALEQGETVWNKGTKEVAATPPVLLTMAGRFQKTFSVTDGNVDNLYDLMLDVRRFLGEYEQRDPAKPCHVLTKPESVQLAAVLAARAVLLQSEQPPWALQPAPAWVTDDTVNAAKAVLTRDQSWFMLDEVQDTDCAQFGFFAYHSKFGAGKGEARLTIVGDFDQSIYSFRGATPVALRTQIAALFPGLKAHMLEINYRSTPAIVAACRAIIAPNYTDADDVCKDLKANRADGLRVQLVQCASIEAEYERIAAEIDAWYAAGVALAKGAAVGKGDGMAVLFWRNVDVKAFAAHLRKRWSLCSPHDHNKILECREEAPSGSSEAPSGAELGSAEASTDAPVKPLFVGTIHAAKGAEFEIVFLGGLGAMPPSENSSWPTSWRKHAKWVAKQFGADQAGADAENRRLQFVAASRPRSLLHVSYAVPPNPKPDDQPCEAVDCIRAALGGNNALLEDLSCAAGQAAALAAQNPHDAAELMGDNRE